MLALPLRRRTPLRPSWRLALVVAAGTAASFSAGCGSTITIAAEDLPGVLRDREVARGRMKVRDIEGDVTTIDPRFEQIRVEPKEGHILMTPPDPGAKPRAVGRRARGKLASAGWLRNDTTFEMPVLATVVGSDLIIEKEPADPCTGAPASRGCRATRVPSYRPPPTRRLVVGMDSLEGVGLQDSRTSRDGLVVAIVMGSLALGAVLAGVTVATWPY